MEGGTAPSGGGAGTGLAPPQLPGMWVPRPQPDMGGAARYDGYGGFDLAAGELAFAAQAWGQLPAGHWPEVGMDNQWPPMHLDGAQNMVPMNWDVGGGHRSEEHGGTHGTWNSAVMGAAGADMVDAHGIGSDKYAALNMHWGPESAMHGQVFLNGEACLGQERPMVGPVAQPWLQQPWLQPLQAIPPVAQSRQGAAAAAAGATAKSVAAARARAGRFGGGDPGAPSAAGAEGKASTAGTLAASDDASEASDAEDAKFLKSAVLAFLTGGKGEEEDDEDEDNAPVRPPGLRAKQAVAAAARPVPTAAAGEEDGVSTGIEAGSVSDPEPDEAVDGSDNGAATDPCLRRGRDLAAALQRLPLPKGVPEGKLPLLHGSISNCVLNLYRTRRRPTVPAVQEELRMQLVNGRPIEEAIVQALLPLCAREPDRYGVWLPADGQVCIFLRDEPLSDAHLDGDGSFDGHYSPEFLEVLTEFVNTNAPGLASAHAMKTFGELPRGSPDLLADAMPFAPPGIPPLTVADAAPGTTSTAGGHGFESGALPPGPPSAAPCIPPPPPPGTFGGPGSLPMAPFGPLIGLGPAPMSVPIPTGAVLAPGAAVTGTGNVGAAGDAALEGASLAAATAAAKQLPDTASLGPCAAAFAAQGKAPPRASGPSAPEADAGGGPSGGKKRVPGRPEQSTVASASAPALASALRSQGVTTLMLRNVPHNVTQKRLVEELASSGFAGLYDFCYMPSTFGTGVGKGYAFLNFTSGAAVGAFVTTWHGSRRFGISSAEAALNVSAAALQGREQNAKKWDAPRMRRVRNPALRPLVIDIPGRADPDAVAQGDSGAGGGDAPITISAEHLWLDPHPARPPGACANGSTTDPESPDAAPPSARAAVGYGAALSQPPGLCPPLGGTAAEAASATAVIAAPPGVPHPAVAPGQWAAAAPGAVSGSHYMAPGLWTQEHRRWPGGQV